MEEIKIDTILDERIQRLMRLVDGVRLKKNGQVSVDSYFAKKFTAEKDYTGSDFGVGQAAVWSEMKKRIDETPVKWKDIDDGFETKLDRIIEKTEEAIEEGDRLIADVNGGSHSDMAERVISGLPSLRANLRVLTQTKELINDPDMDTKEMKKELKSLWMDYDTSALSFDYSGVDNAGGEDASPMEALSDAAGGGLLSLVTDQPDRISDKGIKQSDIYADYYEQEPDKKEYSDSMSKLADEEEVRLSGVLGSIGGYAIEEFALDNYITKMLTGYTPGDKGAEQDASSEGALNVRSGDADNTETGDVKKEWKHALDYGWEYVIAGGKSDRSNLESVLSRILLLRVVANFTAIISDGAKRAEAYAAAAAVVGFIGLAFLIRFTQTLILITWAFVESLTDVAALLMGKDVPLIKTSSGVKTTFPEIFLITNSAITDRAKTYGEGRAASFGYREYIWMFLAMTEKKIRLYRVMDLIEMDMKKNGYEGFNFGQCVFDMTVEAGFFYPAKFFTLPAVEKLLDRDISGREYLCRIRTGYLP
ncbi:MAG: hypothetical protein J6P16_06980 [Eubacterium sp.]|nr:hypothetical protein [Eubacterium sp.]